MDANIFRAFVKGRQDAMPPVIPVSEEEFRAMKRVQRMSLHDLIDWADAAGSGMAKGFDDYRSHGLIDSLYEIRLALVALSAVTEELIVREEVINEQAKT